MLKNITKTKTTNSITGTRWSLTLLSFLLCAWQVIAQGASVSHSAKNEFQISLPGVDVKKTGTGDGTTTDSSGNSPTTTSTQVNFQ